MTTNFLSLSLSRYLSFVPLAKSFYEKVSSCNKNTPNDIKKSEKKNVKIRAQS